MDTLTIRLQEAYDRIAAVFEQHTHILMSPRLQHLAHTMVQALGRRAHLLDVGCGTGRDMAWFDRHGFQTIGIDLSAGMLTFASHRTTGALIQATMQQLPLASASFDGVWCCASLLHLPKQALPSMLQELQRVIRDGGLVMISVQVGEGEQWDGGYVEEVVRFFARYQPDEFRALLHANGLRILDEVIEVVAQRTWLAVLCQASEPARPNVLKHRHGSPT